MSRIMRAKLQVNLVKECFWGPADADGKPVKTLEQLSMHAVAAPKYDADGKDEDNTYAIMSPGADLSINIANPALWGKFAVGGKFYVDFIKAE